MRGLEAFGVQGSGLEGRRGGIWGVRGRFGFSYCLLEGAGDLVGRLEVGL